MRPELGCSNPAMRRNSVVLPQPDGPSSAKNSPLKTSSESWSTAAKSPKRLLMASIRNNGCELRSVQGAKPRLANPGIVVVLAIDAPAGAAAPFAATLTLMHFHDSRKHQRRRKKAARIQV